MSHNESQAIPNNPDQSVSAHFRVEKVMKLKRQKGGAVVELALVTPLLLLMGLGLIQFGWLLTNYIMVSNAASSGALYFAAQRGNSTPYTSTQTQVTSSAAYLTSANLTVSTRVNGTACASDSSCSSALSAATSASSPVVAAVSVTYNNFSPLIGGSLFGLAAVVPSSLSSTVQARVQ